MIDIATEHVISFADAPQHLPRRRGGKRPNIATIYRWASAGCKGVRLESIQLGGTKCTSIEALQRFFDRLTNPTATVTAPTSRARRRAIGDAERQLDAAGI